ncbi:MAG: KR domain-containing protein [Acaryochloris sp. CRU_2_0]|nr:KR domain-containing protein [Acaryochloris sp. CRU_2_0]
MQRGVKHLVLVSRSGSKAAAKKFLDQWERQGVTVVVAQSDVSDLNALRGVIDNIERSLPPLRGIIHAAGVLSDGILQQQTWEKFMTVLAPKVLGGWHLHRLTQHLPLDFFVLFSSTASLFGSRGQSNHAAANAFLDTLAHFRQAQGLPALSIHWGAVSQVGAAADRQVESYIQKLGMGTIAPEQVLQGLEALMQSLSPEIAMAPIDWATFLPNMPEHGSFLSRWRAANRTASGSDYSELRQQLQGVSAEERRDRLITYLQNQVSQILGFSSPQSIDLQTGLFDLGMDSLTALEFRNRLQRSLQCSIPSTVAFDYPTLSSLVDFLLQQLSAADQSQTEPLGRAASQLETDQHLQSSGKLISLDTKLTPEQNPVQATLEQLSDEEAETSLMNTLDNLGY